MALNQIIDLSTTAGNNLDFIGVGIPEGMFPDKVNDAMRALGKILADAVPRHVVKTVGTYAPAKTDHNQFWRCTGAVTLNLTAAATLTDGWALWVRANGGAVTIDPNGAELIDGAATLVLSDGQTALILCTGSAFFVVNSGFPGLPNAVLDLLTLKGTNIASATTTDIGAATGRFVHITGVTTITGLGTKAAGVERELVFDGILTLTHNATSLILPGAANITTAANDVAIMVSEGSGNWRCVSYQLASGKALQLTPWVTYTPTFTGFGTAASISVWSRRVGDTLHIRGKFNSGTSTAVEARMTLGFNGVDGGLTSDATKVASIQMAGGMAWSNVGARAYYTLIESGAAYITFGSQAAGTGSLSKVVGSNLAASGDTLSFQAEIPITGW